MEPETLNVAGVWNREQCPAQADICGTEASWYELMRPILEHRAYCMAAAKGWRKREKYWRMRAESPEAFNALEA